MIDYKKLSKEFRESFREKTDEELITLINREVGNNGRTNAKQYYLDELKKEIQCRDFDSSILFEKGGFRLSKKVNLIDNTLFLTD